jgi:hypothetical protein
MSRARALTFGFAKASIGHRPSIREWLASAYWHQSEIRPFSLGAQSRTVTRLGLAGIGELTARAIAVSGRRNNSKAGSDWPSLLRLSRLLLERHPDDVGNALHEVGGRRVELVRRCPGRAEDAAHA